MDTCLVKYNDREFNLKVDPVNHAAGFVPVLREIMHFHRFDLSTVTRIQKHWGNLAGMYDVREFIAACADPERYMKASKRPRSWVHRCELRRVAVAFHRTYNATAVTDILPREIMIDPAPQCISELRRYWSEKPFNLALSPGTSDADSTRTPRPAAGVPQHPDPTSATPDHPDHPDGKVVSVTDVPLGALVSVVRESGFTSLSSPLVSQLWTQSGSNMVEFMTRVSKMRHIVDQSNLAAEEAAARAKAAKAKAEYETKAAAAEAAARAKAAKAKAEYEIKAAADDAARAKAAKDEAAARAKAAAAEATAKAKAAVVQARINKKRALSEAKAAEAKALEAQSRARKQAMLARKSAALAAIAEAELESIKSGTSDSAFTTSPGTDSSTTVDPSAIAVFINTKFGSALVSSCDQPGCNQSICMARFRYQVIDVDPVLGVESHHLRAYCWAHASSTKSNLFALNRDLVRVWVREVGVECSKSICQLCLSCERPVSILNAQRCHNIAKSWGGSSRVSNLFIGHGDCNRQQGTLSIDQYHDALRVPEPRRKKRRRVALNDDVDYKHVNRVVAALYAEPFNRAAAGIV